MVHRCEVWTAIGINCPAGLLDGVTELFGEVDEDNASDPELFPLHQRAKKIPPDNERNAEMAVLMEVYRRSVIRGVGALAKKVPVAKIPLEITEEAYRQGARGKELGLWVAASAASLAVGLRFGPGVAQSIPRIVVEGLRAVRGGGGSGRGGYGGLKFNSSAFLRNLLVGQSRKFASGLLSGFSPEPFSGL